MRETKDKEKEVQILSKESVVQSKDTCRRGFEVCGSWQHSKGGGVDILNLGCALHSFKDHKFSHDIVSFQNLGIAEAMKNTFLFIFVKTR